MKSILDVEVSCFKNYKTSDNPKPVNLLQWLNSGKYADKVKQIREISDKKKRDQIKATLPAITPSGQFSHRSSKHLIQHSGLIQFDIDGKDHTNITNFKALKSQISKIVNVAYVGLSVSGRGYWGLIPIKHPKKHKSHFRAMKKAFQNFGLQLDNKPSNVASLRGYSYDPNGYFNHRAKIFETLDEGIKASPKQFKFEKNNISGVERLIDTIQSSRTDITEGYENWLRIGFAFADEFGEDGRSYFHAVSQFHHDYNSRATDQQFTHCLRSDGKGITIASFYHLCKVHGITLKNRNGLCLTKKDSRLEEKFETGPNKLNRFSTKKTEADAEYAQALEKDPILKHINDLFDPEIID